MIKKIHLVAACGTGMGTLACILKEMGYEVSGSDQNVYPPMSTFLEKNNIALAEGFDAGHITEDLDLAIIGNAVSKDNPEAQVIMDKNIPYLSMPQAVNRFIAKDKKIILVTGTHGKTTTSSIMAHILNTAGLDPSFLIGGIVKDFDSSFRIGKGDYMVIEGDEYDTAFFDKGPKFMHYDPYITIMTGIEFDHADIFNDIDHIKSVFSTFIDKIKESSHIIAYNENETLKEVLKSQAATPEYYGQNGNWTFSDHLQKKRMTSFTAKNGDIDLPVEMRLPGEHNVNNSLACIAASLKIGIQPDVILSALKTFNSVKRRQEVYGVKNDITIMDDFAHHPTAVAATIKAVKPFYPQGRVIAVFEPRTNTSMRSFFQKDYPGSFKDADRVCICEPSVKKNISETEKFSCRQLVNDINEIGVKAEYFKNTKEIIESLNQFLKPGDLVLIMSNGGFNNIHSELLESINEN